MKLRIQHFLKPSSSSSYYTTMMKSELSLHNRGATMIRTDLTQLGIPDHTTYAGPWPTYINLPSDPLHKNGSAPPENTVLHTPAHCHVGTRYSRHLSTPSARVAILVIE